MFEFEPAGYGGMDSSSMIGATGKLAFVTATLPR
jgi:hypothetical protein